MDMTKSGNKSSIRRKPTSGRRGIDANRKTPSHRYGCGGKVKK